MKILRTIAVIVAAVSTALSCSIDRGPAGTIISNARVVDGSGSPSGIVSVRIVGDRIVTVGEVKPQSDDVVVDAKGLVLSPGFIDVHSHHEYNLLEIPDALATVSQGVTTIAGGMDGGHMYPLADYFDALEKTPAAINVASFAGFGTIRGEIMGEDYMRPATADELAKMVEMLRAELGAGALGLSSGLEYDPGSFSTPDEVIALAKVAAAAGGHYISHIRSEDKYFWEAIDEIINIGREANLP
ncbi:MAG: amidohydrolase family protein, partial [Pseudomonadota bacterium]